MPSFKKFWKDGIVNFDVEDEGTNFVRHAGFREDPIENPLGTPSGKIEIFSPVIAGFGYKDCKGHAQWFEKKEYLGSPKAKKFPFHMVSPHPKFRLHSQLGDTWLRKLYEIGEREPCFMNTEDAKKKGIKHGDIIRIFNKRGHALAGAFVTDLMRPNVIALSEGAWYDPKEPGVPKSLDVHGSPNNLTQDGRASKVSQATIANSALVDVEKYTDPVPPLKVFSKPPIV